MKIDPDLLAEQERRNANRANVAKGLLEFKERMATGYKLYTCNTFLGACIRGAAIVEATSDIEAAALLQEYLETSGYAQKNPLTYQDMELYTGGVTIIHDGDY